MNTKEAINTLEFYKVDSPKHCGRNEELQEIIELLQHNEKYKKLWEGFQKEYWDDTITTYENVGKGGLKHLMEEFEKEYLLKENDNDKKLIKRIRKIIEVINERGIMLEEFNRE